MQMILPFSLKIMFDILLGKTIDNIYYFGAPSKETKYDFFIKNNPILYKNSAYMAYINDFL